MLSLILTIIIVGIFAGLQVYLFRRQRREFACQKEVAVGEHTELKQQRTNLAVQKDEVEQKITEQFLFYELTRKLAPILSKDELFTVFSDGIKRLGDVQDVQFTHPAVRQGYLEFVLEGQTQEILAVKTRSTSIVEYLSLFAKLLGLCLERIVLYEKLQLLSIYEPLTEVYNRRYFLQRLNEEFERAKKSKLNLSFLMVDLDHFKKVNDTYGHLVGDVVLREVASLIKQSIREIDFVARYGGEEFALILPDTDKAGAIMVAERISGVVSKQKIRAFDEIVTVTVSVGVGAFPENTLHSDMLVEISDKALYQAKVSGRNRVCWF